MLEFSPLTLLQTTPCLKLRHNLLTELLSDLEQTRILWQLAVLGFSLALAWGFSRLLRSHLPKSEGAAKVGLGGVSRVAFPLVALLLVVIGKTVLKNWHSINLLNIAASLLLALALVRLAVYALRHIFAPSGWLHSSERFIATTIWVGLALHLTGFLPEILDAMDDLSFHVGRQKISLLLILSGILSVACHHAGGDVAGTSARKPGHARGTSGHESARGAVQVLPRRAGRARHPGRPAPGRHRHYCAFGIWRRPGRRHRLRPAKNRQQLRQRLHHPARPLHSSRRSLDRRQPLRHGFATHCPLPGIA